MSGIDEQESKLLFGFSEKYQEIATCWGCGKMHLTYKLYHGDRYVGHLNCTDFSNGPEYYLSNGLYLTDVTDIVSHCSYAVRCHRGDSRFDEFIELVRDKRKGYFL